MHNKSGPKCKHKILLKNCRVCKGSAICKHNRERYRCRLCKGGGSCIHKHDRRLCKKCCNNYVKRKRNSIINSLKKRIITKYENNAICIHGFNKKKCCICEYTPTKIENKRSLNIDYDWIDKNKSNIHELNYK